MADYTAIADVGETLVTVLQEGMRDLIRQDEIALASPGRRSDGDDLRLTLYLYRIAENGDLKNDRRPTVNPLETEELPLALDLHYLLTAHPSNSGADETERTREQHTVLGRAVQVLHDNMILQGSELRGSLADSQEKVRLTITSSGAESLEGMSTLWSTFPDQPFEPSISYLVSPVFIESTVTGRATRVVEKEDRYRGGLDDRPGGATR